MNGQQRLLIIFLRLISGKTVNKFEMMEKFDKTESSIQRDIVKIEEIITDKVYGMVLKEKMSIERDGKGNYRLIKEDGHSVYNRLSDAELLMVLKILMSTRVMTKKEIEHITSRIANRNSYSKTDHDATFMRVKEDPMQNGQLKPAYNLQLATSNQYIVADAGYGSESNYRYLEDNFSENIAVTPYGTMIKEESKKWKTDERKVINWNYHDKEDYYIDPKGIRFNFIGYRTRTDKDGFTRDFKEYQAEKYDENKYVIPASLTPTGYTRKIMINPSWEYHKVKQNDQLSNEIIAKVYSQRKIDVEPVFGWMKACLGFNRFHIRGINKVKQETGILVLALNIIKLAVNQKNNPKDSKKESESKNLFKIFEFRFFYLLTMTTYVTASFI